MRETDGLQFPNPSRNYEPERDGVWFWGYDEVVEVSFFIGADALTRLSDTDANGESSCLAVFDANLARIHQLARARYSQRSRSEHLFSFTLPQSFV